MKPRSGEKAEAGDDDWLPPEEAVRRRDEALRRLLSTPPKPHKGAAVKEKGGRDKPGRQGRKPEAG